jgi:hypothetical protein
MAFALRFKIVPLVNTFGIPNVAEISSGVGSSPELNSTIVVSP